MNIVILGCGRLGALVAQMMDSAGHRVTVVDSRPERFARLGLDFGGDVVTGIGIDEDVLRRAGIEEADAFVAVTDGDNTNVMACEVAKNVFHVPKVISQIKDPGRQEVFATLQLNTICPTAIGANAFRAALLGED